MKRFFLNKNAKIQLERFTLDQWFSACGTRTTSGTQKLFRWYASHFQYYHKKAWIQIFLVRVLFLSKLIFRKLAILIVSYYCDLHARKAAKIMHHKQNYDFCKKQTII